LSAFGDGQRIDLRTIRRVARRSKAVAAQMERVGSQVPVWVLLNHDSELIRLPETLRLYSQFLQHSEEWLDARRASAASVPLALLTAYVHVATGQKRDQDVADLVSAATEVAVSDQYIRMWRLRHRRLVAEAEQWVRARWQRHAIRPKTGGYRACASGHHQDILVIGD
jgi:hypothetical protein